MIKRKNLVRLSLPVPCQIAEEINSIAKVEFCDRTTAVLCLIRRGLRVYRSDPRRVARIAAKARKHRRAADALDREEGFAS